MNPLGKNIPRGPIGPQNNNDINARIEALINLHDKGKNPNELKQMLMQRNPNFNAISSQYENMVQGKNRIEFLLDYAKQVGVNEQNIQGLARILGAK